MTIFREVENTNRWLQSKKFSLLGFHDGKKTADNVAKLMGLQTVRGVQNISHLRAAGREARWFARRSTLSNFHLCGIDQDGASLKGPLSAV